jgi:hypothetical protein
LGGRCPFLRLGVYTEEEGTGMADRLKHPDNPILGPGYTMSALFDAYIMPVGDRLRMWLSWRDLHSIAVSISEDGVRRSAPCIVMEQHPAIMTGR